MSQQNYSPVNVYPSIPPATDIISASLTGSTGTLVSIPANRAWQGGVAISASYWQIAALSSAGELDVNIVASSGTSPAYTVASVVLGCPTLGSSSLGIHANDVQVVSNVCVIAGTSVTTISVTKTNNTNNVTTNWVGTASGQLL